jgi:hypothetical protein
LLILKGSFAEIPPPRVFSEKRLQAVENKRMGREKERKERKRVCKRKEVKEIEQVKE